MLHGASDLAVAATHKQTGRRALNSMPRIGYSTCAAPKSDCTY